MMPLCSSVREPQVVASAAKDPGKQGALPVFIKNAHVRPPQAWQAGDFFWVWAESSRENNPRAFR